MRRLIVSMNITLDGFLSGPEGELDWHFRYWNSDMAGCLQEQLAQADTLLLGRHTYQAMAGYWSNPGGELSLSREDIAFAEMMYRYRKVVCSRRLGSADWNNSLLIRGNVGPAIRKLKQQEGKNLVLYGSGKLLQTLVQHHLVDEYLLWLHPVTLGKGKPLVSSSADMTLVSTRVFASGVVLLQYRVNTATPESGTG